MVPQLARMGSLGGVRGPLAESGELDIPNKWHAHGHDPAFRTSRAFVGSGVVNKNCVHTHCVQGGCCTLHLCASPLRDSTTQACECMRACQVLARVHRSLHAYMHMHACIRRQRMPNTGVIAVTRKRACMCECRCAGLVSAWVHRGTHAYRHMPAGIRRRNCNDDLSHDVHP